MTAADWHTSTDPAALFRHLRGTPRLSPSRWFRWAVGLPTPLPEAKLRQLLDAVCDLPTGAGTPDHADRVALLAAVRANLGGGVAATATLLHAVTGADYPAVAGAVYERLALALLADDRHNPPLADAVRCLFGDPFRPPPDPTSWRTPTVVAIAQGIAADAAFDRLPVLADALEDAGCDHEPLLAHLRGGSPHRPGCHALDAVLGR